MPFEPFQAPQNTDSQGTRGVDAGDLCVEVRELRLFKRVPEYTDSGGECAQDRSAPPSDFQSIGVNAGQKRLDNLVRTPTETAQTDHRVAGEQRVQGFLGDTRKVTGVTAGLATQNHAGIFIGRHEQPHRAEGGRGGVLVPTSCAFEKTVQIRRRAYDTPTVGGRIGVAW